MEAHLLFLHALSPLHAGTGQGVGSIDLPIAREKATNLPIVPGSTLKGVLRANCEDGDLKVKVFGPETNNAGVHASSAQFADLRLLFLPVRSLSGTFAWVTSPLVLRRYARDCAMAQEVVFSPPDPGKEEVCLVAAADACIKIPKSAQADQVVLEDLCLTAKTDPALENFLIALAARIFPGDDAWQSLFKRRVCVVHDNVLAFLLETATEITARIQLEETRKTVKDGALWYEEALPAESILSGLVTIQEVKAISDQEVKARSEEVQQVIQEIVKSPVQVGGNSTVGRGLCWVRLV